MIISSRKGYTLVEIMIVVTIIAVILAIVVPNYLKTGKEAAKKACINNLKQIDSAIEQWAFDNTISAGTVPSEQQEEEICAYIDGGRPSCPSHGEYVMYAVGASPQVKCTKESEGHKLPE